VGDADSLSRAFGHATKKTPGFEKGISKSEIARRGFSPALITKVLKPGSSINEGQPSGSWRSSPSAVGFFRLFLPSSVPSRAHCPRPSSA
jgi:hypothetical protein